MVLQHVGMWVNPLWRPGTDKANNVPSRFGSILGVLDSFVLFLMRFYSRTCKDEAIDRVEERPWEPAERIYPRCQTRTSLLHTGRTWDDCIQSFLSTLSQTKWDRESRREIRAAAEVSNNLHLICFSSSLPVLSHFCPRLLGNNASVQICGVWLWAPLWFGFFPMNPSLSLPPTSLFFSFPSPRLRPCDGTGEISAPGRCVVLRARRSSSSREHLSKPCSVMTTQQWGNWADPEAKLLAGTGGKASGVRPSLSHPLSGHLALNH